MSLILVCSYSSPPKATKGLLLPLLATKLPDLAPPPADFERTEYLLPKDWHDFACEAPQLLSPQLHPTNHGDDRTTDAGRARDLGLSQKTCGDRFQVRAQHDLRDPRTARRNQDRKLGDAARTSRASPSWPA